VPIRAFKSLTEQNITFPEVKAAVVGSTSISVNATASSGLNVSYRSNDHTICTVFEGYWNGPPQPAPVTLLAVGTCSITAIQEGDNTYAPAADVTRTFKVTAAVKNNTDAAAAAEAQRQRELRELLSVIPTIAGLALNIGALTNELLGVPKSSSTKQKCVKGTKSKYIKKGAKCPAGYKKIK
jgi:hypothetical protein